MPEKTNQTVNLNKFVRLIEDPY